MAWFFMGEGTLDLRIRLRSRRECVRQTLSVEPTIRISNTDSEMIEVGQNWCLEKGISCCLVSSRNKDKWNVLTTLQITQKHVSKFLACVGPSLVGAKREQARFMAWYFDELYVAPGEDYRRLMSKDRWFKILELSEAIFKLRGGKTREKSENYKLRLALIRKHIEQKEERVYETPVKEALIDLYWNRGLDAVEIGELYGASRSTVLRWMRRRNVSTRSNRWLAHEGKRRLVPNPYS